MDMYAMWGLETLVTSPVPYRRDDDGGWLGWCWSNGLPRWHGRRELHRDWAQLYIKRGYAEIRDDGGLVATERGRERIERWKETMAKARRKMDANNARQRRMSLERKLARITAELERLGPGGV